MWKNPTEKPGPIGALPEYTITDAMDTFLPGAGGGHRFTSRAAPAAPSCTTTATCAAITRRIR